MMRGLPPGFRFEPTEEELVFEYLKCKVFSSALPASIIPEINGVWNLDPWDIPAGGGGGEEERYLFSKQKAEECDSKMGIVGWSRSGYWKARGWEREIVSSDIGVPLVGMKKVLDFFTGSRNRKTRKTEWVMHQYRLLPHSTTTTTTHHHHHQTILDNTWVLCRIFCNKLNRHRRLRYSISSTKDQDEDQDNVIITTPTAFSDDDDSVSSTASSSSTSAAFTDFTSPTNPFSASN